MDGWKSLQRVPMGRCGDIYQTAPNGTWSSWASLGEPPTTSSTSRLKHECRWAHGGLHGWGRWRAVAHLAIHAWWTVERLELAGEACLWSWGFHASHREPNFDGRLEVLPRRAVMERSTMSGNTPLEEAGAAGLISALHLQHLPTSGRWLRIRMGVSTSW